MAQGDRLVILESFIGNIDGAEVLFRAGETIDAGHKAVKKWPAFFGPSRDADHPIEQATAAPGEKRGAR